MQSVGRDLYLLAHLPHLQGGVDRTRFIHVQDEIGLLILLKALLFHRHYVRAQRQLLKGVEALSVGGAGLADSGTCVGGGHRRTGYGGAGRILYCS